MKDKSKHEVNRSNGSRRAAMDGLSGSAIKRQLRSDALQHPAMRPQ